MFETMNEADKKKAIAKVRFLVLQIKLKNMTLEDIKRDYAEYYDTVVEEVSKKK